ncbi:MAG: sigma 54-interacting transcriptional regulator [Bdellovibrionaceae bacterium]|nr:sigma 54-interacting transcriptional regulator [Pseudobdellovibrionaceae bacterium]
MNYLIKPLSSPGVAIVISDFMTIGSDKNCQYPVSSPDVSDRHTRLEYRDGVLFAKDMRSLNGTFLNNEKISESPLQFGDILRIGDLEFQIVTPDEKTQFPLQSKNIIWNEELNSLVHGSRSDFPILMLGSSGTGKEVLAKAIHESSRRNQGPLVCVNCSALTETLVESELFGHIKGSFTGAIADRKGAFESARGGTLFLDEIGDLPYSIQAKLLRALENSEIRPVGSDRTIQTDVRILAATHKNLAEKINQGSFRLDLYYRLNVIQVSPPDLAHRMEDFDMLIGEFCKNFRVRFSFSALSELKKYKWPGNIRELKNLVSRASALYPHQLIDEVHIHRLLDKSVSESSLEGDLSSQRNGQQLPIIKEIEKQMIVKRLTANKGNQKLTAIELGMPKSTLHDRLKYYNIDVTHFKQKPA